MKKFLFLSLPLFVGCLNPGSEYKTQDPVIVSGGQIQVAPSSKFLEQIRVVPVAAAPGVQRKLRTVGQMVAMANSSGDLTRSAASWVTLEPELIKKLGLHLSESGPVGLSYGVTNVHATYVNEIKAGERVDVFRYGLKQNGAAGTVLSIKKNEDSDEVTVIFSIAHGHDWYPGTNCQVEFPLIQRQAVSLSPLSMLHEGVREYILKEIAQGQYQPEEVTVLNETKDHVYAIGELAPGDRIIEQGAILLKPIIHEALEAKREAAHVR